MPRRTLIMTWLALTASIAGATIAGLMLLPAQVWQSWQPASCLPSGCFCEALRFGDPIRQPANTWSSLAYIVIGCWIVARGAATNLEQRFSKREHAILGGAAILIGVGSALYHASLSLVGQFLDVLGMYVFTSFMLVYAWERRFGWQAKHSTKLLLIINAVLALLLLVAPTTRRYAFACVLLVAIANERALLRDTPPLVQQAWFWRGLALFAVAYLIWIADITGLVCAPASLLQGHALWHGLGALAVSALYRYYASEPRPAKRC